MKSRQARKTAGTTILAALCVAACGTPAEFLPPPFGPDGPSPTRLFYPTALAKAPDGSLLVANGNFNRAFDGGTLVRIRKTYLDAFFAKQLRCEKVAPPEFAVNFVANPCDDDVSNVTLHSNDASGRSDVFAGVVMIGNYAGPLALNDSGTVAFTGSRDTATLNAVTMNPDLSLACAPNAGVSAMDCRKGIDLTASGVLGPYSIVPGDSMVPGQAPRRVLYVASMTPRLDQQLTGGILYTSAVVGALDMADPTQVLFTLLSSSRNVASGTAVGPMVFDPTRRQLLMSGCFQRFAGGSGEPGTGRCSGIANNYLRLLDVDAGSSANVQLFDLYGDVLSIETIALVLADPDPLTQVPRTLWATMRNPDVLVQVDLPAQPSVAPRVRRVVSLPIAPSDIVRISRTPAPDLLAIVAEKIGAVTLYDTGVQQVVGQVENLGDSPFTAQLLSNDGTTAQLAVSVFKGCKVALLEVPLAAPWQASLRGRVGSCP
jgi:hypothetical protein